MVLASALFFAASFVACAAFRSWLAVALVVGLWPGYIVGVLVGLWGYGVGDNWQYAAVIGTAAVAAGAVAGMVAGRTLTGARTSASKSRRPTSDRQPPALRGDER